MMSPFPMMAMMEMIKYREKTTDTQKVEGRGKLVQKHGTTCTISMSTLHPMSVEFCSPLHSNCRLVVACVEGG